VRVRSVRTEPVPGPQEPFRAGPATRVIEGEVAPDDRPWGGRDAARPRWGVPHRGRAVCWVGQL